MKQILHFPIPNPIAEYEKKSLSLSAFITRKRKIPLSLCALSFHAGRKDALYSITRPAFRGSFTKGGVLDTHFP
jgi:hypothetical protein